MVVHRTIIRPRILFYVVRRSVIITILVHVGLSWHRGIIRAQMTSRKRLIHTVMCRKYVLQYN